MTQQNNQSPSLPLWKRLNGERTQGEWKDEGAAVIGERPEIEICVMTDDEQTKGEAHANAEYTALAVNNLASLAEALSNFIQVSEQRKDYHSPFEAATLLQAKEALNKISQ